MERSSASGAAIPPTACVTRTAIAASRTKLVNFVSTWSVSPTIPVLQRRWRTALKSSGDIDGYAGGRLEPKGDLILVHTQNQAGSIPVSRNQFGGSSGEQGILIRFHSRGQHPGPLPIREMQVRMAGAVAWL